jgi:hypothetical protein
VLLAVLCILLAGTVAGLSYFLDPKRNLYSLEQRLRNGETVSLIDDKGQLAWSRWVLSTGDIRHPLEEPEALSLACHDTCLLELLQDPQRESYRFRADVFHQEGSRPTEVGLYFGYSEHATPQGFEHYYCRLTFNDKERPDDPGHGPNGCKSHVTLLMERRSSPDVDGKESSILPGCGELIDPAPQWRTLIVDVRPDQVQCTWGKRRYPPVTRATLLEWRSKIVSRDLNPEPAFAPRQGLGLYIREGKAWFRRVRVEPLD